MRMSGIDHILNWYGTCTFDRAFREIACQCSQGGRGGPPNHDLEPARKKLRA